MSREHSSPDVDFRHGCHELYDETHQGDPVSTVDRTDYMLCSVERSNVSEGSSQTSNGTTQSLNVEDGDTINGQRVPRLPTQPMNIADLAKLHLAMTKSAVAKANADADHHKAKVSQLTVELSALKTKITQIEASRAAASAANENLIKSLETEREELKSQVQNINAAWTKEKTDHDVAVKTLRRQVSSLEESTRALMDKGQQEKADLTDELSTLNGELNFANSYVSDLEAVLQKTEAACAANERMMRGLEDERGDLQGQVERLTVTQANERSEYDTAIKLLENKVETLLEANASAGKSMADLRAENSSLRSKAMEVAAVHTETTRELGDQIMTLTAQLDSERSERIELQAQSATLEENLCDVKATMKGAIASLSARLKEAKSKAATAKKALITSRKASRHIQRGLQEKIAMLEEKAVANETRLNAQITTLKVELKGVEDQLEDIQKKDEERVAMGIADADAARFRALQQEEELTRLKPLSTELRLLRVTKFRGALKGTSWWALWALWTKFRVVAKVGDMRRHISRSIGSQKDAIEFPLREGDMYNQSLEVLVYREYDDELIGSLVLPLINFESNGCEKEYNLEISRSFQSEFAWCKIALSMELCKMC